MFLVICGVLFLIAFLSYLIPQIIICFLPESNLRKRYAGGWAFITGGSAGIGKSFAIKVAKQVFYLLICSILLGYEYCDFGKR
jgi:hypothetical protein